MSRVFLLTMTVIALCFAYRYSAHSAVADAVEALGAKVKKNRQG